MGRKQASAVPPNLIAGLSAMSQDSAIHLFYGITLRTRPGLIGILFPFFRLLMDVFPLTSAYRPRTLRRLSVTFHQATLPLNAFHFILLKSFLCCSYTTIISPLQCFFVYFSQSVRSNIKLHGSNEPSQLIFLPRRPPKWKK